MTRRERQLTTLGRLKSLTRDEARRRLGAAQSEHAQQQARLQELTSYLQDYRRLAVSGSSPTVHMNREHFITRLHQAVDMQTTVVAQSESRVRQAELGWMATRQDARGVDRLLENERQSQQQAQDRREQSALDEHAVLQFGRAGANGLAGG